MLVVMCLLCQLIFTLNPFSKVCHILINFASYLPTPEPYLHVSMYRLSIYNIIFYHNFECWHCTPCIKLRSFCAFGTSYPPIHIYLLIL